MSDWDRLKLSTAGQAARKEISAEVEHMIKVALRPLTLKLDEVGDAVVALEKEVEALKARLP
jgi:hypothetical protein